MYFIYTYIQFGAIYFIYVYTHTYSLGLTTRDWIT